jgi:DNA-directed RNA polymerase specialized sigma24 family protein
VLHHLGGLAHDEIAATLGISPAAARRRAADGIAALRTRLTGGTTP